jgi:hypothetical protein
VFGNKRIVIGTYTSTGATTGGTISTGLNNVAAVGKFMAVGY